MALKGTLKDFGIADILQLIGQQQKTGSLHLRSKEQQVTISFQDGNIVRAESSMRSKKDLIGAMLVRAEVITEQQLEHGLEMQKRTLRRLGDVLVASGVLSSERFRQMVYLQTTETLYRLFAWKTGSYEFEQGPVEREPDSAPLRAESVLMEGFRMVDEWPVIKKRITSYQMTFKTLKPLPPRIADEEDVDAAFDDAFTEPKKDVRKGEFQSIGDSERRVYGLLNARRDVRKLIDISCLGEFETCKALCNLMNLEFIGQLSMLKAPPEDDFFGVAPSVLERRGGAVGRIAVTLGVLAVLGFVGMHLDQVLTQLSRAPGSTFSDPAAQRFVSRQQLVRIHAAIDVYRVEKGEVPEKLQLLVDAGLLAQEDLRYPWRDGYYYRRTAAREFVLLPPLR